MWALRFHDRGGAWTLPVTTEGPARSPDKTAYGSTGDRIHVVDWAAHETLGFRTASLAAG